MSLLTQYAQAPEILHFMLSQSDCARIKDEPADFSEEGTSRSEAYYATSPTATRMKDSYWV